MFARGNGSWGGNFSSNNPPESVLSIKTGLWSSMAKKDQGCSVAVSGQVPSILFIALTPKWEGQRSPKNNLPEPFQASLLKKR